jgi:hypothetical protein
MSPHTSLVVLVLLPLLTHGLPEIVTKYKCGSDCDEKMMGSDDPTADSMPHTFGAHIPLSTTGLVKTMNAYLKDDPAHQEDAQMVPHPHAVMPDSVVVAEKGENCDEAVTQMIPTGPRTVPISQRIPYATPSEGPALRRPCNLDEVIELFKAVKQSMQNEDDHDNKLRAAVEDGVSPLSAAQHHLEESQKRLSDLEKARLADESLTNVIEAIRLKADLEQTLMNEKGLLLKGEGMLKAPIVKSIGRTNLNLQSAVSAKQTALTDFAQHPAFSKDEMAQLLATYDELIISVKKQLAGLHKEANDVLTPIQLKINQTDHSIEQVRAEIEQLKKEAAELVVASESYAPAALEAARLVVADALNHFNAEKSAQDIDLSSFDQRGKDRDSIVHLIDEMLTLVADIQQPQDPSEVFVEVRQPVSLAGSVPQLATK